MIIWSTRHPAPCAGCGTTVDPRGHRLTEPDRQPWCSPCLTQAGHGELDGLLAAAAAVETTLEGVVATGRPLSTDQLTGLVSALVYAALDLAHVPRPDRSEP